MENLKINTCFETSLKLKDSGWLGLLWEPDGFDWISVAVAIALKKI